MKNISFINQVAMKWVGILLLVLLVQFKANSQVYYPICPGESYTLTAQSGLNNYQWYSISGIDTTAIPGAANMSFTTSAPGTYIWKANNNSGCIVSLCEPVLIVTGTCLLPPDTVYQICPDETYTLVAQTGLSDYQWFTLSGTTETMIPGATNISYIANAPGTYLWTAKDANNCLVKLCTPVQINASTSCAMCPDTTYQICPGESYTLTALAGMASYEWYTIVGSDTLVIAGETNISYITSNAGTYIWKAKDVNGCDVSLCCPVKIVPGTACMPCPDTPYEICPGESYTLTAQAGLSNYQWYTISGTDTTAISGATNLTYTTTTIGTYIWKATDANGCEVKLCCPVVIKEGNCIIPCAMGPVTALAGACNPLTNEYSVSGTVTFTNPPSTGTLTVTSGTKSQTFTAPFANPISYTLSGLVSDGLSHTVTAVFSADPNCAGSATYTAPVACECDKAQYEICPGESYTLTAQAGLSNYQWYTISGTDTTAISGATNLTYTATTIGTYIWKATDANGCEVKLCCPVVIKEGNCIIPCAMGPVTAIAGACNPLTNEYSVSGTVTFTNPPSTGTLTVTSGTKSQTFTAPFASPISYTLSGLISDGLSHTVTAVFSADPNCAGSATYTAPIACECDATEYEICPGESYTLTAQAGLSNYQWYTISGTDTTAISGATNLTYTATTIGTYIWKATDANGCEVKLCCPVVIKEGNCIIPCAMGPVTALAGACNPLTNEYSVSGTVTFTNPPSTGTLTVTSGTKSQTFTAPFASPISYTLSGLVSDGLSHTVTAVFSADPNCAGSATYTAPVACECDKTQYEICPGESYTLTAQAGLSNYQWYTISGTDTTAISGATNLTYTATTIGTYIWKATDANGCEVKLCCPVVIKEGNCIIPCAMGPVTALAGACNPLTNEYSVSGTVTFTNPPSTGTLTVTSGTKSQTFTAPFASPISYTLSGLVSDGLSHTVTAVFSADPNCAGNATYTAPVACECDKTQYEICPGESYTLTAQAGLSNYQWYTISGTDTTAISGATNLTYTATTIGTYIWKATDANGCEVKLCCPVVIKPGNCLPCVTVTAIAENCASPEGKYSLTGVVTFQTPPASGDLVIKVGPHTIIVPAPVTSPYAYVIPDLPADGAVHTVTAYFTGNPDCVDTKNYTAPLKRCVPLQVIKN